MAHPRPIPLSLKVLRGNPGHQRLRPEPMPTISPAVPEPPEYLPELAREAWHFLAKELYRLNLLTIVDLHAFAAYCQAYARWRAAEDELKAEGLTMNGRFGRVQNPLVGIAEHASRDMVRFGAEFGLTPSARTRIATGRVEGRPGKFDGLLAG